MEQILVQSLMELSARPMENRCFLTTSLSPSKNSAEDKLMVRPPHGTVISLLPETQ